ncbi:MAG TPA: hypothetical protein VF590_00605 [Isosphaeraceae bacterium]
MLWRLLSPVRSLAWAAGLVYCSILPTAAPAAEPAEPVPAADAPAETVGILAARDAGHLALEVRGRGDQAVRLVLRNTSPRRLNVVLPPGLVAAAGTGQGFQNMGLGGLTDRPGAFGQFRLAAAPSPGFRALPAADPHARDAVTVPAGQAVELSVPAVCLDFGKPTPTPKDAFTLIDVDDFSADPRVRRALRSLATLGTSQGVAQAVMWHVCNGLGAERLAALPAKRLNAPELALASRFVAALDSSGASELVDPAYLTEARIFVRVQGQGPLVKDARRLESELDGRPLLGLPARVVVAAEDPVAPAPALLLNVTLTSSRPGQTGGRVHVLAASGTGGWVPLGSPALQAETAAADLDAPALARAVDHAVASAFVLAKPLRRSVGSTTLRIENRLPFTVARAVVRAGTGSKAAPVELPGLGVGPLRSAPVAIQAATGTIDSIELNGL